MRSRTLIQCVTAFVFVSTLVLAPSPAEAATITAKPVATGLDQPAAFAFDPSGRIFYGERSAGRIMVLNPDTGAKTTFFAIPNLAVSSNRGLLGLTLHPNYPSTPYVYVYASRSTPNGVRNQIIRLTDSGGSGTNMTVLLGMNSGQLHNGGTLRFGPDGMLYAVQGDNGDPALAQNRGHLAGKVLRLTPAGAAANDNPFGNRVWAYGIRNSFGFAFDPLGGGLWATDNGPECNDELNLIGKGANYGWGPGHTCTTPPQPPLNTNQDGPSPVLPKRFFGQPTAPTGVAFCIKCDLNAYGDLFIGEYNTGNIRRFDLSSDRKHIISNTVVFHNPSDLGILAIQAHPDGRLFYSDGSGIFRLVLT